MAIESIGSSGGFDPTIMARKMAKKMVTEFDADANGSIDKQEFVAGLKTKGISQTEAEKIFNAIDEQGTGKITQSDIENSMKKMATSGKPPEGMPPPPPPEGGGGAPPPDGPKKSEESDDSSAVDYTVYKKADKNKDGEVSAQEQLEYLLTHPEAQSQDLSGATGSVINVTA